MNAKRLLACTFAASLALPALGNHKIEISIRADKPGAIISRHIYGQFAEHLGRGIYEGLWVGEDSDIPNTKGFRTDVVEALKRLRIPNIRWPGGCFADEYHWRDGIGPRGKRPVRVNTNWGGVAEPNAVGTHEFFDLVEMLGADAYIVGNVGTGSPREMAEWLEYITADGASSLAQLRRENGRDEPWRVAFWGVGNEPWKCGGNMRAEYYADLYRRYAVFLKAPEHYRPKKVASGGYHEDTAWTDVISKIGSNIDGIGLHYYTMPIHWTINPANKGNAVGFPKTEWVSHLANALQLDDYLKSHTAVLEQNDPAGKIGLFVDEWGSWYEEEPGTNPSFLYQQNTIRDAVVAAINFNMFHNHAGRIRMANIAQMVNVLQAMILTDQSRMVLTPTYHAFAMHIPFQDSTSIPIEIGATPRVRSHDTSIPSFSASAGITLSGELAISLINLDPDVDISLSARVRGFQLGRIGGHVLTGGAMDAHNTFTKPDTVNPERINASTAGDSIGVTLPAASVVVLIAAPSGGGR